jgi:hypothetical protein
MPGMLDDDGYRCVGVYDDGTSCWVYEGEACTSRVQTPALPDLTDPATLGCVLALVREAWATNGVVFVGVEPADRCDPTAGLEVWLHWMGACNECFHGATEAEALVLALEAAPVSP